MLPNIDFTHSYYIGDHILFKEMRLDTLKAHKVVDYFSNGQ